jgi:glutaredoxin
MTAHVEIYYASICSLCTKAIEFFRSRGVTFTAYSVGFDREKDCFIDSPNTAEMFRRCGKKVDFVPQIFIGDRHIPGWRALEPMIASGEIDSLLK